MAYQIRYGPKQPRRMRLSWVRWGVALTLGVILLVGSIFSQRMNARIQTWLAPEQLRRDEAALQQMAEQISVGEGWYASAVAYCKEIMVLSENRD